MILPWLTKGKIYCHPHLRKTNQTRAGGAGEVFDKFVLSLVQHSLGHLETEKSLNYSPLPWAPLGWCSSPLLHPPLSQSPRGAILVQSRAQNDPMHQILKIASGSHHKPPSRFVAFVAHHSLGTLLPGIPFALFPPVLEPAVGTICPNCLALSQPFRGHVHSCCCVSECLGGGSTPRVRLAVASLWPRSSWRTLIGFCLASCHPDQGIGTLFSQMDLDLSKMVN